MINTSAADPKRQDCWNRAFYAHATAYIFECRANRLRVFHHTLTFFGLALPLGVGALVTALAGYGQVPPVLLVVVGLLAGVQLLVTLASVTYKLDDRHMYAVGSMQANQTLASAFKRLAEDPPTDFARRYEVIVDRDDERRTLDSAQGLGDKEKRKGHRKALLDFQKQCVGCKQVPQTMKPAVCGVCGDF